MARRGRCVDEDVVMDVRVRILEHIILNLI